MRLLTFSVCLAPSIDGAAYSTMDKTDNLVLFIIVLPTNCNI